MMNTLTSCPVCGGPLGAQVQKVPFTYKGQTIELDQSGQFCASCQEAFLSPSESRSNDLTLKAFRNAVDGLLTPDQIKAIRKRLHLSQSEAARIFGGGPMAFSKYERGEVTHSRALDIVLRLLDTGTVTLDTVKAMEPEMVAV
jgi:HTH-type transcriptional regulator/antitoxin MqsA